MIRSLRTRIRKWGNSLAIRIPRPFAEESHLHENSDVDVTLRDGKIVVVPALSLDDLVKQITPRNRHRETESGGPVGNEIW